MIYEVESFTDLIVTDTWSAVSVAGVIDIFARAADGRHQLDYADCRISASQVFSGVFKIKWRIP